MTESLPLDLHAVDGGCLLRVRVKAKAATSRIIGGYGGALKLSVKEAPERGKANQAVCRLLARVLGVSPASVSLATGDASHDKTLRIEGIAPEECRRRLAAFLDTAGEGS
jgi:uncharacterized protein